MSTHAVPVETAPATEDQKEIRIVSHSNLFYWWPIWALGFVLGLLSFFSDYRLAIVPEGTVAGKLNAWEGDNKAHEVLVVPADRTLPRDSRTGELDKPRIRMSDSKAYGVIFTIVLLLVIVITNVPMRGLWSVIVIILLVLLSIIFWLAGWWDNIIHALDVLHIHINAAGYFVIAGALFVVWLVTFLVFDRQIYMVFTPGQLRVRQEIGGGESAYDTAGMVVQKQRNDLFRHWILGLGSGDLIVNTSGAHAHHFDLPNVLFVGNKVQQIEEMLREKPVVRG
jgi:hypothetical protein